MPENVSKRRGIERREAFLAALAELGGVGAACRAVDVSRSAYEKWRSRIPDFKERVDAARLKAGDGVEEEGWGDSFEEFRFRYFRHYVRSIVLLWCRLS